MNAKSQDINIKKYQTGILPLDTLLDGGLPESKIMNFGTKSGDGITTIMLQICKNIIQTYDKNALFIDVDGGVTRDLLHSMGMLDMLYDPKTNPEGRLLLFSTAVMSDIIAIMDEYAKNSDVALVIIDTATQVINRKMITNNDLGTSKNQRGGNAIIWNKKAKTFKAIMKQSNASLIITHQARINHSGFHPILQIARPNGCKYMASIELIGIKQHFITNDYSLSNRPADCIGHVMRFNTNYNPFTKRLASLEAAFFFEEGISNSWTWKTWLEKHSLEGEKQPMLQHLDSGGYRLTLPSGDYNPNNYEKLKEVIEHHHDEIEAYVASHGGIELKHSDNKYQEL